MPLFLISRKHTSPRPFAFVRLGLIFLVLLMLLFSAQNVHSADVTFTWDPNSEPDILGYRIFCRQEGLSYDYDNPVWEGIETTCTIYNLDENTTHYFVARAFDTSDNESADSNEVCYDPLVSECKCDINEDGWCDMLDWQLFIADHSRTDCSDPGVHCKCDLNEDGRCDMLDWAVFSESWIRSECQAGL